MRKQLIGGAICTVAMLAAIWFYQTFKYEPSLSPAPGYMSLWLTRPSVFVNLLYSAANFLDIRPCAFDVLGWSSTRTVYYRQVCDPQHSTFIEHDLQTQVSRAVDVVPIKLSGAKINSGTILPKIRAAGVRPVGYEPITRPLLLKGDGIASPDNRYVAFVSRAVYGPEDVLVLFEDNQR